MSRFPVVIFITQSLPPFPLSKISPEVLLSFSLFKYSKSKVLHLCTPVLGIFVGPFFPRFCLSPCWATPHAVFFVFALLSLRCRNPMYQRAYKGPLEVSCNGGSVLPPPPPFPLPYSRRLCQPLFSFKRVCSFPLPVSDFPEYILVSHQERFIFPTQTAV